MAYTSRKSAALSPAAVRAFAREKGLTVGNRGRFSATVVAAYLASDPQTLATLADQFGVKRPKDVKKASAKSRQALAETVAPLAR